MSFIKFTSRSCWGSPFYHRQGRQADCLGNRNWCSRTGADQATGIFGGVVCCPRWFWPNGPRGDSCSVWAVKMNLLLDTHLLIWAASMNERLSSVAFKLMEQPQHQLHFSALSLWKITIKRGLGRPGFIVDSSLFYRGLIKKRLYRTCYRELT